MLVCLLTSGASVLRLCRNAARPFCDFFRAQADVQSVLRYRITAFEIAVITGQH
jgi:hypothetical protein